MVLETAQLLSTTHRICQGSRSKLIYNITHRNHPAAVWVRTTVGNYKWTYRLFAALAGEFEARTGKVHKSWAELGKLLENVPKRIPEGARTPWVNCTPHKDIEDVHEAYRATLREKWMSDKIKPKWGSRTTAPF